MSSDKMEKRTERLMRMLADGHAVLTKTASAHMLLLTFPGIRSIRCSANELAQLERSGATEKLREGGEIRIRLTEAGRAALKRRKDGVRGQHGAVEETIVETAQGEQPATVDLAESPLGALARLRRAESGRWLETSEVAAGERLRCDFESAMLQPRVTASWDAGRQPRERSGRGNAVGDLSDRAIAARDRFHAAADAVGPELAGPLIDVCCFLKGLEQVERERQWPRRSAKLILKVALSMLDRHYHPPARGASGYRQVRHWGADGYRPKLYG